MQIDVPETWETFDLTQESIDTILEELRSLNPEFASVTEQALRQAGIEVFAFDAQSVELLNNFSILSQEFPLPLTVPAIIEQSEAEFADLGITVLAADSSLTIGGMRAGSLHSSWALGPIQIRQVAYLVLPEPNVAFFLTLTTTPDDFDALEPLFTQMAESFRVLDSP